jgi:hypothetical protein
MTNPESEGIGLPTPVGAGAWETSAPVKDMQIKINRIMGSLENIASFTRGVSLK